MASEVQNELTVANIAAVNEDDKGKDAKNELNNRNGDVTTVAGDTQDDAAVKTQDKGELDEQALEAVDDPPDSFFDGLLEEDFLDSLAVVDAWNPDNDESCGSNAEEQQGDDSRRGRGDRKRQPTSESKRKNESISKRSLSKGGKVSSDRKRSRDDSGRKDDRRHAGTSAEVKRDSRERSAGKTAERSRKGGIGEHLRDVQKRYKSARDRDRDRRDADKTDRRDADKTDRRDADKTDRRDADKTERREKDNKYKQDRKSREKDAEKNVHGGGSSRENNDKSAEKSAEKCDKGRGHRLSNQDRASNRGTTSDKTEKERKSDLSSISVDGKDGELQNLQGNSRRDDVTDESLMKEESCDINGGNKEIRIGSVHKEHDVKKERSLGPSHTKPHNSALSNTKLDTCIKELDDVLPPGTESDFVLPTKDEVVEFKKETNTRVKEKCEVGIIGDKDVLSGDWKSFRHPVKKTDRAEKETRVAGERSSDRKLPEGIESEKDPSCTTSQRSHKEAERLDSSRERKRRRSGSSSSARGKSSASGSKKRPDRLDEEKKREPRNGSSEEKKRNSTSLDKKLGAVRVKSEWDETGRRKTFYGSDSGKDRSRSRSRDKWQHHSDPHRLERKKVDKNDTRRSRSGSRGKKRELSVGRERMGRSRSRDRQYRKTLNDTRRSRSVSRGKGRELFLERESMGRSRDQNKQSKRASSAERWQSDIDAHILKRINDVRNGSRRLVRSVSRDKERDSSLPIRKLRSHSRDREYRDVSSKYREVQGRPRRSVSVELEKRSPMKSRRSQSWDKYKRRTPVLSPFLAGRVSLSSSISFELSPSPPEREWRHLSRSPSRERRRRECRRSYRGTSLSPHSGRMTVSRSDSDVSLSLSDESYYRRQPKRKRSPFWKEIERKFAEDFKNSMLNQPPVYPLPSEVGPTQLGGYDASSSTAPGTFSPSTVPYPTYPPPYTPGYPPHTGFPDNVVQPPPPQGHIPLPFGPVPLVPPVHLPAPPVMPPPLLPQPVPPPLYNVPPPALPVEHHDTVAPFSVKTEQFQLENVFSQPLHDTEETKHHPQVPPPPRISQSCDKKQMSLSSLLEASAKVGDSAKKKQTSFDPLLVARCEEAVRAFEANDGVIPVCPGHLVLQESPKPHPSAATVTQALLDSSAFTSPILRKPDLQLSFTCAPVCEDDSAESSYNFMKLDTKSVKGQLGKELTRKSAVTSPVAQDSVDKFIVHVDSSTMTDIRGDYMKLLKKSAGKSQNCWSCFERSKKIMVWNYTQTPPDMHSSNKVMVWNCTQTPRVSVESVGVQAQMVNIGSLRRLVTQKRPVRPRRNVKDRVSVKSDADKEKVNKSSAASHANVSKSAGSGGASALKEDTNKEVSESMRQSPRRSHLPTSTNIDGGRRDKDSSHRTSSYQIYGKSPFPASSCGRSDKQVALPVPVPQSTEPPKGILKTRSNIHADLQPPPVPSPYNPGQEPSMKGCDLPRYPVASTLQPLKSYRRDVGNPPGLYGVRQSSSSFGEMEPSGTMQRCVSSSGSKAFGGSSASFSSFGNPDIRVTLSRSPDFNAFRRDRFSPSLPQSGSPGMGLRMQPFEEQSSKAFHHQGDYSMMPYDADRRY